MKAKSIQRPKYFYPVVKFDGVLNEDLPEHERVRVDISHYPPAEEVAGYRVLALQGEARRLVPCNTREMLSRVCIHNFWIGDKKINDGVELLQFTEGIAAEVIDSIRDWFIFNLNAEQLTTKEV